MPTPELDTHPWLVHEPHVRLDTLPATESVFSLSNGYLGIRGTLEEAEPCATRGSYLAGVFETHPLSYPEGGYGHPEQGEAMVAVADGTPVDVLVDGVPLDVTETVPEVHERTLDLRTGVLSRRVVWATPTGRRLELCTERLVSLSERSVAAIRLRVSALDGPVHLVVRSTLAGGEVTPTGVDNDDPRVGEALEHAFEPLRQLAGDLGGALVSRTRRSAISVAAAVEHTVTEGSARTRTSVDPDHVVTTLSADLDAGQSLAVVKTLGYSWSPDNQPDALLAEATAALTSGLDRGWDALVAAQRSALEGLWERADVEVDGDPELQQALRYDVFQLWCAGAHLSGAPVGAKGLSGTGYSGHTFWDIEGFVLPALTLIDPDAAARMLRWRTGTLDHARRRAGTLGLAGASFAWRTISGAEVSAYWPASTAAMHVNADISRAFWLHQNATGRDLDGVGGLAVLVETARLWMSLGHEDEHGRWHLFGLTGPDEYTGVVDDNVFTNLMARANLRRAAEACRRHPDRAAGLGVDHTETARWRATADIVHLTVDEGLGVHAMNDNFTAYREWPFAEQGDRYPIQAHHHYATFYRRQVLKQADLVQALWWCREAFGPEEVARDVDYYEARTVRDSSLSASVQAVVCAQAQHPDLALRYLRESALVDLRDLRGDTAQGLHLASVGGTWLALVAGLGGMREDAEELELAPLLPAALTRTVYRLTWRDRLLRVETTREQTTLTLLRGEPVPVVVDGSLHRVGADEPVVVPLRRPDPLLPEPTQPVGREPSA